jgi:transposase
MRAYSMDLRERVFRDTDAGMTSAAVAEKYAVSRAWVDRLKQRRRETGEVSPRAQRYGPHPKLGPHLHRLADLIHEQPDRTLAELQVALGLSASLATIWRAVKQLGFTVKKNGARVRARPARHRRRAPAVAGGGADVGPGAPRLSR